MEKSRRLNGNSSAGLKLRQLSGDRNCRGQKMKKSLALRTKQLKWFYKTQTKIFRRARMKYKRKRKFWMVIITIYKKDNNKILFQSAKNKIKF